VCRSCRTQLSKQTSLAQLLGIFALVWLLVGVLYVGRIHLDNLWFIALTLMAFLLASAWVHAQSPLVLKSERPTRQRWAFLVAYLLLFLVTGAAIHWLRTLPA
jgi:hypothetical protein